MRSYGGVNPKDIAGVFKKGHLTNGEATIMFVRCAEMCRADEIVMHVPEGLRQHFREFVIRCPDEDIPTIGLDVPALKRVWIHYRNTGEPPVVESEPDNFGIQWRKAKRLVADYRKGELTEGQVFYKLVFTLPDESLEEIVPLLDEKHKESFIADLRVIAKPGWKHFSGWKPSEEQVGAIRAFLVKYERCWE
jgi:hypothetical protein